MILPLCNLHPTLDAICGVQAVFVDPLTATLGTIDRVSVHPIGPVTVVGDGKLGLLVAQVLRLNGCALCVMGRYREKCWSDCRTAA